MRTTLSLMISGLFCLFVVACKEDPAAKIPELEAAYAASNSDAAADSLLQTYQAAIDAHPDKHAENLHYRSKAAMILFDRKKDVVSAVRMLNEGLEKDGAGQDLAEPIGMLARIWCAYQYKSTPDLSKRPNDIDLMRANLEKNMPWIDSSLIRLGREMRDAPANSKTTNLKAKSEPFMQIAEAYSTLLENSNSDKYVEILLQAARLASAIGDYNKALRLYYNVAEKMPDHPKAPEALFMMGFIYDENLKDLEKAKSTYELFLKRYPNDPDYADDATFSIKYLGIPKDELFKQLEQNPQ